MPIVGTCDHEVAGLSLATYRRSEGDVPSQGKRRLVRGLDEVSPLNLWCMNLFGGLLPDFLFSFNDFWYLYQKDQLCTQEPVGRHGYTPNFLHR